MTDYNTHALNQYQQKVDMKDQKEAYQEQCKQRAYEYFKGQISKVDGANLDTEFFSQGNRNAYSFLEMMAEVLGGKNYELDRLFYAVMQTKEGADFLEELACTLGDKYSEIGEIDSD